MHGGTMLHPTPEHRSCLRARRRGPGARVSIRSINGLPGLLIEYAAAERKQAPRALLRCELGPDGRIREIHTVLAGRKLTAVQF